MQNDIIAKIDALVKISDSSSNVSTMKVELRELECSIKEKKLELKELKSSISDDKYFDASGEIVDKNIEISLTKKIKSLKKSLAELEEQINKVSNEEAKYFNEVENLKKDIVENEEFLKVLNVKISTSKDGEKNNFKALSKELEAKLKEEKKELDKQQKAYEKIQNKLEVLSYSKNELQNKLDSENEKLVDVKANLLNKRGYINSELKKEDQDAIEKLEQEIEALQKAKTELLEDPVMMGEEAKTYLIDDDKTSALKKIKELRDFILKQPYMDIDNANAKEILAVELENAEAKRDEFTSMINSKNYESVDTTLIKDRIAFITDKKEKLLKEIDNIKEKIKNIDVNELEDLNNRINYCENEVENLKNKIEEYENTLKNEDLSITKKASLQASFDKKQEELNNILELLNSYKKNRKELIVYSYDLEENDIKKINEEINTIDEEMKKLEKLSITSNKAKDTIAMENDKKALKDLNDNIKSIKRRQALKNTPNELYDEIEIILGTDNLDYNNEVLDEELPFESKTVEPEENEVLTTETPQTIEEFEEPKIEETINIDSLPVIEDEDLNLDITDINSDEEKIKVVNVEPLDSDQNTTEDLEENSFLIGDYKSEE
jgi:hypothetical protein